AGSTPPAFGGRTAAHIRRINRSQGAGATRQHCMLQLRFFLFENNVRLVPVSNALLVGQPAAKGGTRAGWSKVPGRLRVASKDGVRIADDRGLVSRVPMMAALEIKPHFCAHVVSSEEVALLGENERYALRGKLYAALVPLLDGTRDADEL